MRADKRKYGVRDMAQGAVLIALAMVLSFLESRIPAFVAVPGVKIGFANIAVVVALYRFGAPFAGAVSLLRVVLVSLLFGNAAGWIYSTAGALFAWIAMWGTRAMHRFSPVGVSVAGGVAHNIGQILAACVVLRSGAVWVYLPVLVISGTLCAAGIGLVGGILICRLPQTDCTRDAEDAEDNTR